MKKFLITILGLSLVLFPKMAMAQNTLLPETGSGFDIVESYYNGLSDEERRTLNNEGILNACDLYIQTAEEANNYNLQEAFRYADEDDRNDLLACAISSGRIHMWMIPYFIRYIANFFIGIAGTISVLFVMLGGFWYMMGGVTDDKEKGKKTIIYALLGLGVTLIAWIAVNVIQVQLTG